MLPIWLITVFFLFVGLSNWVSVLGEPNGKTGRFNAPWIAAFELVLLVGFLSIVAEPIPACGLDNCVPRYSFVRVDSLWALTLGLSALLLVPSGFAKSLREARTAPANIVAGAFALVLVLALQFGDLKPF